MNEGILLVDKPPQMSSFSMVAAARRRLKVQKIGHGGTLDPFATGLVVLLVGKKFTKRADEFLQGDKEYFAKMRLGVATDSFDTTGEVTFQSDKVPTLQEVEEAIKAFQGTLQQVPPMFSAKKINGVRLYEHARKGRVVERAPVTVQVAIQNVKYSYPYIECTISCSKGTYVRALADDIGRMLGCYAHLEALRRDRCGSFSLDESIDYATLSDPNSTIKLLCPPSLR